MPPTEQLREEFYKFYAWVIGSEPVTRPKAIADFWLSKLIEREASWMEKIRGMRKEKSCKKNHENIAQCIMQECLTNSENTVYNSAIEDILALTPNREE